MADADKEKRYHSLYMDFAERAAQMSYAVRRKVGSVIVKDGTVISHGWNGTPSGHDNCCEFRNGGELVTKSSVIHAELNAIAKAARVGISTKGATLYVTMVPCVECAKAVIQSGISVVVYKDTYRLTDGLNLLHKANLEVIQHGRTNNE